MVHIGISEKKIKHHNHQETILQLNLEWAFLKTVSLSVTKIFFKVQQHRVILINKEHFCQLCGKMNKVCFFPRSEELEQRCKSLGALLGLSSANGSITGKFPWTELAWGWCTLWDACGGGELLQPGTAQSYRNCQGWTRSCKKFSFSLVLRGGFAPEKGKKKLMLKKNKCFELDGFMCLFWSMRLGKRLSLTVCYKLLHSRVCELQ